MRTRILHGVPADAISVPADSVSVPATVVRDGRPRDSRCEIYNFDTSCTNAKVKYSSSVVPPDPSVHFYHWAPISAD